MPLNVTCRTCGKPFPIKPSQTGRRATCSKPCSYATRQQPKRSLEERLRAGLDKDGPLPDLRPDLGPCWIWMGKPQDGGYGAIGDGNRSWMRVHRAAWIIASGGPIPDGFDVLHVCDRPLCGRADDIGTYEVNGILLPRRGHLFLGTDDENAADKAAKGRAPVRIGEQNTNARLIETDVVAIRALNPRGREARTAVAERYGISVGYLKRVLCREVWKHL
jgi:hypothetical protein